MLRHDLNKLRRRMAMSLALFLMTGLLWAAYLWPVPKYLASGIPCSSYTRESFSHPHHVAPHPPQALEPGDHLQLLYHFDLFHEMVHGEIPLLQNPYEFNFSDHSPPRKFDFFYAPFSLPYTLIRLFGSESFAWNITQFISVLIGTFFLFMLAKRLGGDTLGDFGSLACAILANSVPYLWHSLSGGSPTGFAMSIIPGLALGIDMAIRDNDPKGGLLAGCCLLASYMADLHSAFFAFLSLPFWMFFSATRDIGARRTDSAIRYAKSSLPILISIVLVVAFGAISKGGIHGSAMANGFTLEQVSYHSPSPAAICNPFYPCAFSYQFNIGIVLTAVIFLGISILLLQKKFSGILLTIAAFIVFSIALGTNGPANGALLKLMRAIIPKFRFLRQPVKIFCLLPTLVVCITALSVSALTKWRKLISPAKSHPVPVSVILTALALTSTAILAPSIHAGVCLLTQTSPAYRTAIQNAEASGRRPKALMLPIIPGGDYHGAVYQYVALHNHLGMLNGYAPTYPVQYDRIYKTFKTIQRGDVITPAHKAALLKYHVNCIFLHENIWDRFMKNAPFDDVRAKFENDTCFHLLEHTDGVWAYAVDLGNVDMDEAASNAK